MLVIGNLVGLGLATWWVVASLQRSELSRARIAAALATRERELTAVDMERRRAEAQFRLAIEASPTGMILADAAGQIVLVNRQVEVMFGYDRLELIGRSVDTLVPERFRARHPDLRKEFDDAPSVRAMGAGRELFGLRRDGTEVPIEIGLNPIETAEGRFVLTSIVDITERKRGEEERSGLVNELQALTKDLERRVADRTKDLHENEARYRALFNDSPIALLEKDYSATAAFLRDLQQGMTGDVHEYLAARLDVVAEAAATVKVLAANRRSLELFEAADEVQLLQSLPQTFDPDTYGTFRRELVALATGLTSFEAEGVRHTLKGRRRHVSLRLLALPGYEKNWSRVVVSMVDITASKEAEQRLRESVSQQEVLLKEIHHRVKNNLAVISSLFYLESTYTKDEQVVKAFQDSQRRIRSMALVHETLYGSGNLAEIDFGRYARVLSAEILATYEPSGDRIHMKTDLQAVKMSIDLAVPSGLILNELISNAFKHAFPNGQGGTITVAVRVGNDGTGTIQVSDDGVGVPADLNIDTHTSLGLRLIRSLVGQIGGTFALASRHPGTEARITFALEKKYGQHF